MHSDRPNRLIRHLAKNYYLSMVQCLCSSYLSSALFAIKESKLFLRLRWGIRVEIISLLSYRFQYDCYLPLRTPHRDQFDELLPLLSCTSLVSVINTIHFSQGRGRTVLVWGQDCTIILQILYSCISFICFRSRYFFSLNFYMWRVFFLQDLGLPRTWTIPLPSLPLIENVLFSHDSQVCILFPTLSSLMNIISTWPTYK